MTIKAMEEDLKPRVLIVEDDPALSQIYSDFFRDKYEVQVADSGIKAIKFVHEYTDIAAAVLDYKLPDISGLEVLRKLKESNPKLPVIFTTGYGSEEIAIKAFLSGVRDDLKKPFSFAELLSRIEYCIRLRTLSQEDRKILEPPKTAAGFGGSMNNQCKLEKAIRHIHQQYAEKINVDMIAKIACMSKRQFSRVFRETVGMTFRDYIIELRIGTSQELLITTNASVTEIAFEVGFFDLSNFERMFKKRHGCSPQQYRKKQG